MYFRIQSVILLILIFQENFNMDAFVASDLEKAQKKIYSQGFKRSGTREPLKIFDHNTSKKLDFDLYASSYEDKELCIISYASFNYPYPFLLKNLEKNLRQKNIGFILRLGGWPNMQHGCLNHSSIPYGFKACAFIEALNLGYKKIIWLDSRVELNSSIAPLLEHLDTNPVFYRYSLYPFKDILNEKIVDSLSLQRDERENFIHIATGIIGINTHDPKGLELIIKWHEMQSECTTFHDYFPEQVIFSVLVNRMGLQRHNFPNLCSFSGDKENSIFKINYSKNYSESP
jgi:hypothetical protein